MSVSAAIKFTQGATTDLAGRALFGVLGSPVVASNGDNSNVYLYTWTVIDVPPGSAVATGVVAYGNTPTFSFTPDVRGGYHLQLTVQDRQGNTATDDRVFGVQEVSGRFIPAFKAAAGALNFAGQLRGWAKYMEEWLHAIDLGAGWVTATTIDFSALANQDLANGTYTLGGVAGIKRENSAHDATIMKIVAGAGLQITPDATSTYQTGTRTAPLIWIPLSSLSIPNLDWATNLRIWFELTTDNPAANYDTTFTGIDSDTGGAVDQTMAWSHIGWRGSFAGAAMVAQSTIAQTSNLTAPQPLPGGFGATNRVLCFETRGGVGSPYNVAVRRGPSAAFGVPASLFPMISYTDGGNFEQQARYADLNAQGPAAALGVVLGSFRNGSATAYQAQVKRLRVDYLKG